MVSVTIEMSSEQAKELRDELNVKLLMGLLTPRQSMIERLAVFYAVAVEKGDKIIHFKEDTP